jgi:hypothetical protein
MSSENESGRTGCVGKGMIYSIIYSITVRKERRGEI